MEFTNKINIIHKALAFLQKDWRVAISYKLQFFSSILGVLISTMLFYFFSNFIGQNLSQSLEQYGGNYFAFVLVGIALADYLVVSTESFSGAIRSGQVNGTFEALLVTPTSIMTILINSYIYPFLFTTFRMLVFIILGVCFFGIEFHIHNVWICLFTFSLTLLPFMGMGLLSAAFIILFKQGSPINWVLGVSSTLLGGVLYPVSSLPAWIKPFSLIFPLTYGIEAMRKVLLANASFDDVKNNLFILVFFSIIFLISGIITVKYSLKVARKQGTLLHY
jgi:ABC-2 type transport system permease protein